jgi:hypothetical protein
MLERPAVALEGGAMAVCLRSIRSGLYVLLIVVSDWELNKPARNPDAKSKN